MSRFVPIRFVANNKLSASDKIMAAFEALSLAKVLGTKPAWRNFYDIGNDVFEAMLDSSMGYSCGYGARVCSVPAKASSGNWC